MPFRLAPANMPETHDLVGIVYGLRLQKIPAKYSATDFVKIRQNAISLYGNPKIASTRGCPTEVLAVAVGVKRIAITAAKVTERNHAVFGRPEKNKQAETFRPTVGRPSAVDIALYLCQIGITAGIPPT